ncbi:MAG: ATP-binding cassette domain-containing protein, partial [Candidatus Hodarchaeales archaeon]
EKLRNAISSVHIDELNEYLPDGLQTLVGERGKGLSAGQKQLISFARAILTNPKILILDEATSSVDAYTEAIIQEALDILLQGRTSIIIAHRLSTILNADRILVMDKGEIIEEGTHQSLLEGGGTYSQLYKQYYEHQSVDWSINT